MLVLERDVAELILVFVLFRFAGEEAGASQGWMGYFGQALKTSANYLPSQVTDMLNQGRDFAFARMPTCGLANVCAIAKSAAVT